MPAAALRPVHEQVVVITGASSGIGREAAIQFAQRGARVVVLARRKQALDELCRQIERVGGECLPLTVDVSDWQQVEAAAEQAAERFGRIDTWINNAAVSLYARVEDASIDEIRRVIDVALLGALHGCKAALPHVQKQGRGAIINVSSVLGKRSVPLQSAYCAAKHGVKGFTESLRMELEEAGSGVSVTLVTPSSVNTPLFEHARCRLPEMPQPLPPVYEPRAVAEALVFAAQCPRRRITVGGAGKALEVLERLEPRLADFYLAQNQRAFEQQKSAMPESGRDNLFEPMDGTERTTGKFGRGSKSVSWYTRVWEQGAGPAWLLGAGAVAAGVALLRAVRGAAPASGKARGERPPHAAAHGGHG